jgi:anionic cell wall polymer biosynthesis LytR-Cps2A-Psr (LCP) family protein
MFRKKRNQIRRVPQSKSSVFSPPKSNLFTNLTNRLKRLVARNRTKDKKKIKKAEFRLSEGIIRIVVVSATVILLVLPNYFLTYPVIKAFYSLDFEKEVGDHRVIEQEWKGERRINILIVGLDSKTEEFAFIDSLAVLVIDPIDKSLGIFAINPSYQVYFKSIDRTVELRKAYNIGRLEEEPVSMDLILEGVESLVSVSIDRYITLDEEGFLDLMGNTSGVSVEVVQTISDEDIKVDGKVYSLLKGRRNLDAEEFLGLMSADSLGADVKLRHQADGIESLISDFDSFDNLLSLNSFIDSAVTNIKSNISRSEFRRLIWVLRSVSFDSVKTGYTKSSSSVPQEDGTLIPIIERIDKDVSEIFFNFEVQKEQARIEVLNGTEVSGLGTLIARWISNTGGKVINVSNSREKYTQTTIYVENLEQYGNTILEIKSVFKGKAVVLEESFPYRHTGDIVIVIGQDFITR